MTPTTCTRCGAPLPADVADRPLPAWCDSCAARPSGDEMPAPAVAPTGPTGTGTWGGGVPAPAVPPTGPTGTGTWGSAPPMGAGGLRPATRRRIGDGLLVGMAAATLAGVVWWAVVAGTERQFFYGAVLVGILVGQGVLLGVRRGGIGPAVVAGVATLAALVVAEYFIQRSLAISQGADVPLWMGFSTARDVVRDSLDSEPLSGLFWLLAAGAAAVTAGSTSRRPIV